MATVRRMSQNANAHAVDGSDSEEEDPTQRFLLGRLKDNLNVRRHHRAAHAGLKRRMGFWKMGACRYSSSGSQKYYSGTHWDVDVGNTEGLTRKQSGVAVDKQMDREKERRTKEEAAVRLLADYVLTPLRKEIMNVLTESQAEMEKEQEEQKQQACQILSDAQAQLVHKIRGQEVEDECQDERNRRENIMDALMGKKEKMVRTDSFTDLLKSLSETDDKMGEVQDQLMSAFFRMEDDDEQEQEELKDLYKGMRGDMVSEILHASGGIRSQVHTESERKDILFESHNLANKESVESAVMESRGKVFDTMEGVTEEMMRLYAGVQMNLGQKQEKAEFKRKSSHSTTMQELSKRSLKQQVHRAMAQERARRIREAAEMAKRPDPGRIMLRELVGQVQEEMLIKKFHGRKVAYREPERSPYCEEESEQDRMLRNIRLSARRRSCAIAN
ncbi:Hypp9248 [Branchiostoma lanceolatum]|uniref:Hypp9248 protein n=1 Tax=Branchiostoma lanceolatum TaxID=7740 RepID=A0A8J9ZEP2_BRALA|nr:Hypp9248 [Branchiostoma lanceolatum]